MFHKHKSLVCVLLLLCFFATRLKCCEQDRKTNLSCRLEDVHQLTRMLSALEFLSFRHELSALDPYLQSVLLVHQRREFQESRRFASVRVDNSVKMKW